MFDISMCQGEFCLLRERCRRFTAIPNSYYQSYLLILPEHQGENCDMFWSNTKDGKNDSDK